MSSVASKQKVSRIKTFLIGRHPDCDLILSCDSVSRRHAEVVFTADGNYYVTDRNSTGGTFVYSESDWNPLRQGFIKITDRLRFGDYEMAASRLEELRSTTAVGGADASQGNTEDTGGSVGKPRTDDGLDPCRGLELNPETGELQNKT